MSNENRDYPAWLDEELFASLTDAEAPKKNRTPPAESSVGEPPAQPGAAETNAPAKKKKKKAEDPEQGPDEASPKKKKKKASDADEAEAAPKRKKKKVPDDEPDEPRPKKKKKTPEKTGPDDEAPPAPAALPADGVKEAAAPAAANEPSAEQPEEPDVRAEKLPKPKKRVRGWLVALIVAVSLALLACIGATVCAYLVTTSQTNLPNVYLGKIYVGGLTREETMQALEDAAWAPTKGGTLTVTLPEEISFELDFLRAGACQTKAEAAEAAFRYGHGEDWFDNLATYLKGVFTPVDLSRTEFVIDRDYVYEAVDKAVSEFETRTEGEEYVINEEDSVLEVVKGAGQVTLDREAICERSCALLLARESELVWDEIVGEPTMPDFAALAEELNTEPVNAFYDPALNQIFPESKGVTFDAAEAERLWEKAGVLEKFSVPITLTEPEITAEGLKEMLFRDKLGACTTYLWGSTANRISNIRLACSRFNGKVLQPGETFSYNTVVGERTEEAGFKLAPTYSGTAHIDGLGGGICQVSSTLYNAVQQANLRVDARVCHTMLVGYLAAGLDATVDWPDVDFVFTNDRDYPIQLFASVDDAGHALTIEIMGTNVDGSWVEVIPGEWPAYDETYREYGYEVQVGVGAWNFRRVHFPDGSYEDGEKVYSYYHFPDEDIHWPDIEIYAEEETGESDGGGES